MKKLIVRSLGAMLTALAFVSPALSQDAYPSRPIRVIVPYPAGGVVDLFARVVTDAMAKRWSQPIVVEVRPGAGTNIGTLAALQSKPDGYTWLIAGPSFIANPSMSPSATWDPVKDFAGVGVIGRAPLILAATEKLPVKTLRELVDLAKSKPGMISSGTMNGSSGQFVVEELKRAAGVDFLMVPYAGVPPIMADLVGGNVQISTLTMPLALPYVGSGKIKMLAIASDTRSTLFPDVPTVGEAGFPAAAIVPWYGFVVPRGTPAAIVKQINAEINEVLKSPDVQARILKLGGEVERSMTPDAVDELIKSDLQKYSALIKRSNIKVN